MGSSSDLIPDYFKLLTKYRDIVLLQITSSNLGWDSDTSLPKRAVKQRADQIALLADLIHQRKTSSEFGQLIEKISSNKYFEDLEFEQRRNVELLKREYDSLTKIPTAVEKAFVKQKALTYEKWQVARKKANFELYEDEQIKLVDLVIERAECLDPEKKTLDVLMDQLEPGLNLVKMEKYFSELKSELIPLVKKCASASNQPDMSLINRPCPDEIQYAIALDLANIVGYEGGRIDTSVHPISRVYYDDARITTRFLPNDFSESFSSILHESGHALYSQNYPLKYKYQPIGSGSSMGMHEGMARFVENFIGMNPNFLEYYLPRLQELTNGIFADVDSAAFLFAFNNVTPTKLRIGADEVTYNLHLIFRMEIEQDLFDERITVSELPEVWNQKMLEYFDIEIENDAEGVLQDMHWPYAAFGYFPNFAFGNIYGGQLLWKMAHDIPDWETALGKGDTSKTINWLKTNVYQYGCLYDSPELVQKITGAEVSTKYFLKYLKDKFSKIYGF